RPCIAPGRSRPTSRATCGARRWPATGRRRPRRPLEEERKDMRLAISAALAVALASTAFGQAAGQGFRDPVTGKVWTPENVGGGASDPSNPANRAFNPQAQAGVAGSTVQTPNVTPIGTVPITAGPSVPIAVIDNATLSAIPSQRWQVVLYLNNNSANTINPVI